MKFGRIQPRVTRPTLAFGRYIAPASSQVTALMAHNHVFASRSAAAAIMPARPIEERWEHKAIELLHDPAGNNDVGDCTCAGICKLDVGWTHNAGDMAYWPDMKATALGLYERAAGYNPADPSTDRGAELSDILTYVQAHGIDSAGRGKGIKWVSVDATKPDEVVQALNIFGGLYTGVSLSPDWVGSPVEGGVWDIGAPGIPEYGHCVAAFDYNAQGVIINSWGLFITVTWRALAAYWCASAGGEVYAIVSPDWISAQTGVSPSGLNTAQLIADLKAL